MNVVLVDEALVVLAEVVLVEVVLVEVVLAEVVLVLAPVEDALVNVPAMYPVRVANTPSVPVTLKLFF